MKRIALSRGHVRLVGVAVVIIAILLAVAVAGSPSSGVGTFGQFRTLPPSAQLPSEAQCARWVRESPSPEIRPSNNISNHTAGQHVGPRFFPADDRVQAERLAARISGDFTGTTEEILRWAACKWGISQNIVFAQAAVESWWRQNQVGDWGTDPDRCPRGHGLGAGGMPGKCPQSYGILQNKYPLEKIAWPAIGTSTAMNVDAAYAIWRSCYDGYEVWLNNEPKGQPYHAGDLWGCVGRWFAGSWYTPAADRYIEQVKAFLQQQIWRQSSFVSSD